MALRAVGGIFLALFWVYLQASIRLERRSRIRRGALETRDQKPNKKRCIAAKWSGESRQDFGRSMIGLRVGRCWANTKADPRIPSASICEICGYNTLWNGCLGFASTDSGDGHRSGGGTAD